MSKRKNKKMSLIKRLGISALFGGAAVVGFPLVENVALSNEISDNKTDSALLEKADNSSRAIFVLTGGAERVETGVELAERLDCPVFISGCNPKYRESVEARFSDLQTDVILGFNGYQDTFANAREIGNWLNLNPHIKDITIVTSDYHMKRTLQALQREITDIDSYNIDYLPVKSANRSAHVGASMHFKEFTKVSAISYPVLGDLLDGSAQKDQEKIPDSYFPHPLKR